MSAADIHLSFRPWPKQALASYARNRYKMAGGGRGGGKSAWIAGECWDLLVSYPGNVGFLGRADLEDLRRSALKEFFQQDRTQGLIAQHHQTQMWIDVETAQPGVLSRLYYGELKDPTSQLGVNLGFFGVDQAEEIPRASWDNLGGNLRHRLPDGTFPPFVGFGTANPAPCWIMDLFPVLPGQREAVRRGEWPHREYGYFPFLALDNPANPPDYADVLKDIYRDDPVGYRRMVLGEWDVANSGLVYDLLPVHRWKAPTPGARLWRAGLPVSLAIDPSGGAVPYGVLVLQEIGRYVCIVDEFYGEGASDEAVVDWVKSRPWARSVADAICDPAAKASIDRLRAYGLPVRGLSRPKDIRGQILGVRSIMGVDPATGFAPLLIDENFCTHLIAEFGAYHYKPLSESDRLEGKRAPETPVDRDNHLLDPLAYWVREKKPSGEAPFFTRKAPDRVVPDYYRLLA